MKKIIFFITLTILCISLVSSLEVGNKSYELRTSYAPGERLVGWINISLSNENGNSLLESNLGQSIKIMSFLEENNIEPNCLPKDCKDNYKVKGEANSKSVNLEADSEVTYAFKVNGELESIDELRFAFSTSTSESCIVPLRMDLTREGVINWEHDKYFPAFDCVGDEGCFNSGASLLDAKISNIPYCEKMTLNKKPGYLVKARIFVTNPREDIEFDILDSGGALLGMSCDNDTMGAFSEGWREVSCVVDGSLVGGNYYVCVSSTDSVNYLIKAENSGENCGFKGSYTGAFQADYEISVSGARYSGFQGMAYNNTVFEPDNGNNIHTYVYNYIKNKYNRISGNKYDCTNDCVIPLTFYSGLAQSLSVSNIYLGYTISGIGTWNTKIYDVEVEPAKISSGFKKLDLSLSNFTAPSSYGDYDLVISLNGETIFNEEITVAKIPIIHSIYPNQFPAGSPVTLYANVSSPAGNEIVEYNWSFGHNGASQVTLENKVTHSFPAIGVYSLTLNVKDEEGMTASKSFTVTAGSPREAINATLKKYREMVDGVETELSGYSGWFKGDLENEIGLGEIVSNLNFWEQKYHNAYSDEDLVPIMGNLSQLKIPFHLGNVNQGSMPWFVERNQINLDHLESMGAGSFSGGNSSMGEYLDSIENWVSINANTMVDYKLIALYYEDGSINTVLSVYDLSININDTRDTREMYLVFPFTSIKFNGSPKTKDLGDSTGVTFDSINNQNIGLLFKEEILPDDFTGYISPEFIELDFGSEPAVCNFNKVCEKDDGETWKNCRNDCKPFWWMVFWFFILMLGAFIVYIILQEWYRRRYENYLFKNRSDLYNLVNFMKNALSQGMDKGELTKNLKKAGWDGEQVTYAFKKTRGIRIGMLVEIPITKLFRRFPKKRQPAPQIGIENRRLINKGY
ncbi:MAG: PKD domain-containing protein [archaeon]